MDYLQEAQEIVKSGGGVDLMVGIKKWEKPGEAIAGILESYAVFESSDYETTCRRYTLDTGEGRVSTVLGAVVDRSLEPEKLIGHMLYIEYEGKEKTRKGNMRNVFKVLDVSDLRKGGKK